MGWKENDRADERANDDTKMRTHAKEKSKIMSKERQMDEEQHPLKQLHSNELPSSIPVSVKTRGHGPGKFERVMQQRAEWKEDEELTPQKHKKTGTPRGHQKEKKEKLVEEWADWTKLQERPKQVQPNDLLPAKSLSDVANGWSWLEQNNGGLIATNGHETCSLSKDRREHESNLQASASENLPSSTVNLLDWLNPSSLSSGELGPMASGESESEKSAADEFDPLDSGESKDGSDEFSKWSC